MSDCLLRRRSARGRGQSAIYFKTVCPVLSGYSGQSSGYSGPGFFYFTLFCPLDPTTIKYLTLSHSQFTLSLSLSRVLLLLDSSRAELCSPPTAPRPSTAAVRRSLLRGPSQPRPAPPPHLHEPRSSFPWQESTALSPTAMGVLPELRPFASIRFSGSPPPKSIMGMDSW